MREAVAAGSTTSTPRTSTPAARARRRSAPRCRPSAGPSSRPRAATTAGAPRCCAPRSRRAFAGCAPTDRPLLPAPRRPRDAARGQPRRRSRIPRRRGSIRHIGVSRGGRRADRAGAPGRPDRGGPEPLQPRRPPARRGRRPLRAGGDRLRARTSRCAASKAAAHRDRRAPRRDAVPDRARLAAQALAGDAADPRTLSLEHLRENLAALGSSSPTTSSKRSGPAFVTRAAPGRALTHRAARASDLALIDGRARPGRLGRVHLRRKPRERRASFCPSSNEADEQRRPLVLVDEQLHPVESTRRRRPLALLDLTDDALDPLGRHVGEPDDGACIATLPRSVCRQGPTLRDGGGGFEPS